MRANIRRFLLPLLLFLSALSSFALQVPGRPSRFDALVIQDPSAGLDAATLPVESLDRSHPMRERWDDFRISHGPTWRVVLDGRSGAPLLVEGQGIPWNAGAGNALRNGSAVTLETLEASLRGFIARHRRILLADEGEMVLNRTGSGQLTPEVWQVVFDRAVLGVPVAGDRYVFTIGHGNLISFGATRWGRVTSDPIPTISSGDALRRLFAHMGLSGSEPMEILDAPGLLFLPLRSEAAAPHARYSGPIGAGYSSALAWRIVLRVEGEAGTWVGQVDARTGAILSLVDDDRYAQVKGGAYPVSDDQICPDGCEQPSYPMPFADLTVNGNPSTANTMGLFDCTGGTATTTLAGPYVRVSDNCGAISQSVACDANVDLLQGPGTDCSVPAGSSPGNTHASRTGFYHLNRIVEHARAWLPGNTWLTQQLTDNGNISATCNAYWDGAVNFYRSGGGCNNTGEIAGILLHEWGHGLDQNDGGGYDNPSEAYADITAVMSTHVSCVGRGFFQSGQCGGYGNACSSCTGVRDLDWNQRANHAPSTPSGFVQSNCSGGGGPCGKEVHCEGYVGGETLWDLAVRDLTAGGLDQATAWQLTDKLWYKSRQGSGGNAYNCSLPSSDGCAATSWFSKLRNIDDDDGNLANGTPHAAAIFAAFNRHGIACGAAGDASNQSTSSCPALAAPTLTTTPGSTSASLSWTTVSNAASYNVLRNDAGCSAGSTIIATVPAPATSFTDTGLANGFTQYYRVQGVGSNAACDGSLSSCQSVTPQPLAGSIALDRTAYACSAVLTVTVTDANVGGPTTTATLWSTTETAPQSITLTWTPPGSATYTGSITATPVAPSNDGLLSLSHGDTITARYIDADDGQGHANLTRETTASADCLAPVISNVAANSVTGSSATITWTTNEPATSVVHYGTTTPPSATSSNASKVVYHTLTLNGLSECSAYSYSVESADAVANTALDDVGGAYHTFVTGRNTGVCGPHAKYLGHSLVADSCASGGAGNGDGIWDSGEQVQFRTTFSNDGTTTLTGLTATVTSTTPGVTITDATASFPDLPSGSSGESIAPHFTAQLPTGFGCGTAINYQITISSNEGGWSGVFNHATGRPLSGTATALTEDFASGMPASWFVIDGASGGGPASTWTTANPGERAITAPLSSPIAIVDSDSAGASTRQDEQLISPVLDLAEATTVSLEFDQYFRWDSGGLDEIGDVDVRSSATSDAWVNVFRNRGASSIDPDHRTIDITQQAAGATNVQARFYYHNANSEWYWQVDNVGVSFTAPAGCSTSACGTVAPRPVPDGTFGSAMRAGRLDPSGSTIHIEWDAASCVSANYHALHGDLANVATYAIDGAVCNLGASGTYNWYGAPSGSFWFIIAGDNATGTESTWGTDSSGAHRGGTTPSNQCGSTSRDNGASCP